MHVRTNVKLIEALSICYRAVNELIGDFFTEAGKELSNIQALLNEECLGKVVDNIDLLVLTEYKEDWEVVRCDYEVKLVDVLDNFGCLEGASTDGLRNVLGILGINCGFILHERENPLIVALAVHELVEG